MSDEDTQRLQDLHDTYVASLQKAQQGNADQFDRAVLTLSASFLAVSIAFIGDVIPIKQVVYVWLLYTSWILFGTTIVTTLLGILAGQRAIKSQMGLSEKFYIEGDRSAYAKIVALSDRTDLINEVVGVLFALAIISTISFAVLNFGASDMPDVKTTVAEEEPLKKAHPTLPPQKVPVQTPEQPTQTPPANQPPASTPSTPPSG